jgi:hypothetical protein
MGNIRVHPSCTLQQATMINFDDGSLCISIHKFISFRTELLESQKR